MTTEPPPRRIEVRGISIEVVRKEIRNLHVGVYPPHGRVRVAAPLRLDDVAVRLAIVSRLAWIRRKQAEFECQGWRHHQIVLRFCLMSHTLTIRLQDDLAEWVERTAKAMGVSQGRLIRDQLERARREDVRAQPYLRLAGSVRLDPDLSTRKGFSPS